MEIDEDGEREGVTGHVYAQTRPCGRHLSLSQLASNAYYHQSKC